MINLVSIFEKYFKILQLTFDFWHVTMVFPLGVMFISYAKKNKILIFLLEQ